jgi:hypothetical protein
MRREVGDHQLLLALNTPIVAIAKAVRQKSILRADIKS